MKNKSIFTLWLVGMLVVSMLGLSLSTNIITQNAQGAEPILDEPYVYEDYDESEGGWTVVFEVFYKDLDGDEGDVILFIKDQELTMDTDLNIDPLDGRCYYVNMDPSTIQDEDTFYFYAEDTTGNFTYLGSNLNPFQVGDFLGWGEKPILSEPYVYYDDDSSDYVFGVTYQDLEDDAGCLTLHVFNETEWKDYNMDHTEGDPINGENFEVNVPDTEIEEDWEFYFEAWDERESTTLLPDQSQNPLVIADVLGSNGGNGNGDGDGDGDGGISLPKGWLDNPEVVVGILGLVAIGAGSAYGVYRRKKKHSRFSELLTQLDDIYGSYKLNPKRCETELEKLRATINEDLKKNIIDENNYSILKGRIDDIILEIREESLRSQVTELPKDIELKIKDMLIDGEITRAEYDKLLPIIKGSDMASTDKEKMEKMVKSWVKEEKEKK